MKLATARLLVGRTIVDVDLRPYVDENDAGRRLGNIYDPVLVLDNGARVTFSVQETDAGCGYGIEPHYHARKAVRS